MAHARAKKRHLTSGFTGLLRRLRMAGRVAWSANFINARSRRLRYSAHHGMEKVANDTVALLSAEAGRHPYDRRLSDLIGELSTRSDEFVSGGPPPTSRFTAPAPSSSRRWISIGRLDQRLCR
jgi:hypothetical protein